MSNTPWYSEEAGFFGADYMASYADSFPNTEKEVTFLETKLGMEKGIFILDCPCGHGRHSVELAKRGYSVLGQDLNGYFLDKAREDADKLGVAVRFRKGDMRDLPFEAEFDIVLNLFTAFGYFDTEEEDQEFLNAVAKSLKPKGKFFMDFINRDRLLSEWRSTNWQKLSNGLVVCQERRLDFTSSREYCKSIHLYPDGKRKEIEHCLRLYTLRELILMCKRAGLETNETFGDFEGNPASVQSKRVILIAQNQ
jgi:SAM-dependent methyltransferase